MADKWIWLPVSVYPDNQTTRYDAFSGNGEDTFTVAEFTKTYDFGKKIENVRLRFSADTEFQLFCNDEIIATGPAVVGGDFLGNGKPREWYYATETEYSTDKQTLSFFARVKMCPVLICDYSKGHGGFMLDADVVFEDGTTEHISTDESWKVRKNSAYRTPLFFDGTIAPDDYVNAEITADIWHCETAPIPPRTENEIIAGNITLAPGEETEKELTLDMIYAGFLHISAKTDSLVTAELKFREIDEENNHIEKVKLAADSDYRSFYMHSAGNILVHLKNESDTESSVKIGFITTCYPVTSVARTVTSDNEINDILKVCEHTLRYCRQTHHLDSPRHCEPLACTGDYYIESLMTSVSFGDMRLAEFDILRTAELLRHNDGRIFHTTYSLIWVRMLYDTYMISGNFSLLEKCRDALDMLMDRFLTYIGDNGLIENPPDYMFVDWIYIDGITMHHPPKCLGQTVLNTFFYMALDYAVRIYSLLADNERSEKFAKQKESIKNAVNTLLYDAEKGMFFDGLNTPTDEKLLGEWMPQNIEKRYYLKQSNILAAYTGICGKDTAKMLIEKVMTDEIKGDVQPYFMHYLLEAICDNGLRDKYTIPVIERWKASVKACSKGLAEGFVAPEPTYKFDHSHAWGGTPLYSLTKALTGLAINEAGYKKITLSPSLLCLENAVAEIPTPFGFITCRMKKGKAPEFSIPEEIQAEIQ